jgi:hypothetical protein
MHVRKGGGGRPFFFFGDLMKEPPMIPTFPAEGLNVTFRAMAANANAFTLQVPFSHAVHRASCRPPCPMTCRCWCHAKAMD